MTRAVPRDAKDGGHPCRSEGAAPTRQPGQRADRITIPPDTMTRIAEALTTGSSIIVSDQGINQAKTGEDTDFTVPLR